MGERRLLKVDLSELCSAMEDSSWEHTYYLDLETGGILFMSDMKDEETKKLRDDIDENPDRYESIPKAESSEGYEDIKQQEDEMFTWRTVERDDDLFVSCPCPESDTERYLVLRCYPTIRIPIKDKTAIGGSAGIGFPLRKVA